MADLVYIVGIGLFFAICVWYVRAADRMIEKSRARNGSDETPR